MTGKKLKIVFSIAIIFVLAINECGLCIEINQLPKSKYPDFAYEFVGKDKHEKFNRRAFKFNMKLNNYCLRPINILWASIMPKYGTERLQNLSDNVEFPIRFFSCIFQKDFKGSGVEAKRFFINSTAGLGGMFDVAKKMKIEKRDEDMGQALSHFHIKQGCYWVVPIISAYGNTRDLFGKILDCSFNPTSYVGGPFAVAAKALLAINKTTLTQPLVKTINSNFADPYEITKLLYGVDRFIKSKNLDRKEVLAEKISKQNLININTIQPVSGLNPDITLKNFVSQGAITDAMRTVLYDNNLDKKSIWNEISVWNKTFKKKIKTGSISMNFNKNGYKYEYILQPNPKAPLAILYPSIGEGRDSAHSITFAQMLYKNGYSIIMQGSSFQWEFKKSMPKDFYPGFPQNDAKYLKETTAKIISQLHDKYSISPDKKIIIGTSYGAMTALFAAAQDELDKKLNVSKFICISPPVDILYAVKQIDGFSNLTSSSDIKTDSAVAAEKVLKALDENSSKETKDFLAESTGEKLVNFPVTEDESKLITTVIMKQKLSDLVFTIENDTQKTDCKKIRETYNKINNMSFYDYAKNYLQIDDSKSEELAYKNGLYSISDFLKNSNKYKIYQSVNDYYTSPEQLIWLKNITGKKSTYFSEGSHLGYIYRKEFIDQLTKDITTNSPIEEINTNQKDTNKIKLINSNKENTIEDSSTEKKIELRN